MLAIIEFIKMLNNSGPKIDPCGTLEVTATRSDIVPSRTTLCSLSEDNLLSNAVGGHECLRLGERI